jgi:aldose 1-epimerase
MATMVSGTSPTLTSTPFGTLSDGSTAQAFTLTNSHGTCVVVSDFGATLISVETLDREDRPADITLGYGSIENYDRETNPYFGASIGRFANRIAHGKFELDGVTHQLAINNDPGGIPCHLHGGHIGFNRRLWKVVERSSSSITFEYTSPAGEEHYPGTLVARISYTLNDENELQWDATATTDAATPINLVNHTYWNLTGERASTVHDHILTLPADHYLPATVGLIPTGERHAVAGTPLDFLKPTRIGDRLHEDFETLRYARGYDACWILNEPNPSGLAFAARTEDPRSGRVLEVFTNQPGIHFYSGNFLNSEVPGRGDVHYQPGSGLCLETEGFPDAPNHPEFPCAILRPGGTYRHRLSFRFSVSR